MNTISYVSIIIPCRNEEKFIGRCLNSILANDYPKDKLEILIIDGMSEDNTREVIKRYTERYPSIKLLENPKKITPSALNIGIKKAQGEIIIRMDAHATYIREYISKCVKYLKKYDADNTGGIWIVSPSKNTLMAKAIAFCLSHPFGTGNAYYKIGSQKARWADTVPFGCYKREVFQRIGLFNENLVRSQDMEFNLRLRSSGGKILLIPEIVGYYYPKSDLKGFFVHNFEDGIWAIYPLKFVKRPFRLRHYVPLIFTASLLGTGLAGIFSPLFFWSFVAIVVLYFLLTLFSSLQISKKEKDLRYLFILPLVFVVRHISYGFGSLWGLVKLLT